MSRNLAVLLSATLLAIAGLAAPRSPASAVETPHVIISEVDAAGSGASYGADWWELTNLGNSPVTVTGWRVDDSSFDFSASLALSGVTNIAPGESVIFLEGTSTHVTNLRTAWFGMGGGTTVQVGTYSGSGVGLSTGGDGVVVFDGSGAIQAKVSFGAVAGTATLDNAQGINGSTSTPGTISALSVVGTNSAFLASNGAETGSPGSTISTVDLSRYVRVGRYDLPEPTRTAAPANSNLAQEASAITYNWDTDTLFVTGDHGTSVVQVTKQGDLIDSMTLALGDSPQGTEFYDTEGLTYIGGGQFVLTEERYRQVDRFTYAPGTTLQRAEVKTAKLGTTIGNVGLEGISYDPQTDGYILVKEKSPLGIFQTTIDWDAGTASNGSPVTEESTNLFDPALAGTLDVSDVFALSNVPSLGGHADSSHLLILSQESGQIINVDRAGNVMSRLTITDVGSPLSVADETHEGITMDRQGFIYTVNENGGGDADHPQLWVWAPSSATNSAPTAISLTNAVTNLPENTNTSSPVQLATIVVTDADGIGPNELSVSGADAASFQIIGTALLLKAGESLDQVGKPTYTIDVNVDDPTVGDSPDATTPYTLTVDEEVATQVIISEVAPWSSGDSSLGADWFELTNVGAQDANIVGWSMDDDSALPGIAPLLGITSIAAGESVIFAESGTDLSEAFKTIWFGDSPPLGLQIGRYSGSSVGLSTGGDQVHIFDTNGAVQASVLFGANAGPGTFLTFDNAEGINGSISTFSQVGVNGAFSVTDGAKTLVGSPGTIGGSFTPTVSIVATDPAASEEGPDTGTFKISRTGATTLPLDVNYTIATGPGQATPDDYTPNLTSPETIPAGQSFVEITITPEDDDLVEGPETVTMTLGDTGSYDVGSPASATVTIADNDVANNPPTAVTLTNTVPYIIETASTISPIRVADISVTDDGQGTNELSVGGPDASSFEITGLSLYLKADTELSHAAKAVYDISVEVDDVTVGTSPDATANLTVRITQAVPAGSIIVSEIAPWSSGDSHSSLRVDWFEVTNTATVAMDITGWRVDDDSHSFGSSIALTGVSSIGPGESVIFMETNDPSTKAVAFRNVWFGASPPAGLRIGSYSGSGIGFGTGGDEVDLFDAVGNVITGISFGASPTGPFATFDNRAGLGSTSLPWPVVSTLSVVGVNSAFAAVNDAAEIGSPGLAVNVLTGILPADASGNEGSALTSSGSFDGTGVVVSSASAGSVTDNGDGSWSWTYTPADNFDPLDVTVVATDAYGYTATETFSASVANVAPSATLTNNGPVSVASPATISFTGQSDPSSADTTAGFHYAFDCANGDLSGATYASSSASASTGCTFGADGAHTVKGRIIDKDGGFNEYTTVVSVTPVADSPYAVATSVLASINAALPTATKHDRKKLKVAKKKLTAALTASRWIDGAHLTPATGDKVFKQSKKAVKALLSLAKDNKTTIASATLRGWAASLVTVAAALAETQLSDSTAAHGNAKKLAKAQKRLNKAAKKTAKGKLAVAVGHYRAAWRKAEKSIGAL